MKSISVVYPAYNEELYVKLTIEQTLAAISRITDDFEIIVVDDASTDNTLPLLRDYSRYNKRIKIFCNETNSKLGGTLRKGFKEATKELVLYSDFDMPFDLNDVAKAIEVLEQDKADLLSAFRINRNIDGLKRTFYSIIYNRIINFLFRVNLKDVNFSFKLFKRSILNDIILESEGSFISAELLIRVKIKGFRVVQLPVVYYCRSRGRSYLASMGVVVKIIKELINFYFKYFPYFLKNKGFVTA
jgi:glycosyltransferase involved in cell wall biosynthesis